MDKPTYVSDWVPEGTPAAIADAVRAATAPARRRARIAAVERRCELLAGELLDGCTYSDASSTKKVLLQAAADYASSHETGAFPGLLDRHLFRLGSSSGAWRAAVLAAAPGVVDPKTVRAVADALVRHGDAAGAAWVLGLLPEHRGWTNEPERSLALAEELSAAWASPRAVLARAGACPEALQWVGGRTADQAWADCTNGEWLIWAVARFGTSRGLARALHAAMLTVPADDPAVVALSRFASAEIETDTLRIDAEHSTLAVMRLAVQAVLARDSAEVALGCDLAHSATTMVAAESGESAHARIADAVRSVFPRPPMPVL